MESKEVNTCVVAFRASSEALVPQAKQVGEVETGDLIATDSGSFQLKLPEKFAGKDGYTGRAVVSLESYANFPKQTVIQVEGDVSPTLYGTYRWKRDRWILQEVFGSFGLFSDFDLRQSRENSKPPHVEIAVRNMKHIQFKILGRSERDKDLCVHMSPKGGDGYDGWMLALRITKKESPEGSAEPGAS